MPKYTAISQGWLGSMIIRDDKVDAIQDAKALAARFDRPALVLPVLAVVTAKTVIEFDVEPAETRE